VLYAKLTLLQVRASLFMLEASSPPAQRPGKGLSFVLIVAIRRTQWKENAPVELKWRSSNIVLLYSLPFNFFFNFFFLWVEISIFVGQQLFESYYDVASNVYACNIHK
jgi:hypothetical protein